MRARESRLAAAQAADDLAGVGSTHRISDLPANGSEARELWYLLGWNDAHSAIAPYLRRLEAQADLWYYVANNPGKRPLDYYRHRTDALWESA